MAWGLKKAAQCGTARGYDYHTRQLHELPCEPCRQAKADHWRVRRERNREAINARRKLSRKQTSHARYERDSSARRADPDKVIGGYSRNLLIQLFGTDCHICQKPIDLLAPRQVGQPGWERGLHFDHVIPISKGGADTVDNVRPAHAYCNQTKGTQC